MAIPVSYNIRNLRARKTTTLMTVAGLALSVAAALFVMALLAGLRQVFVASGDPLHVLVMRKGAESELASAIEQGALQELKTLNGIAVHQNGEPMASGEIVVVIVLPRRDGASEANVTVRGMTNAASELRPNVKLVQGRWFEPGKREVVVSNSLSERFAGTKLGGTIEFGKGPWTVVGIVNAVGTTYESEIWADVNQIGADFDRYEFSSVLLSAKERRAAQALVERIENDERFSAVHAQLETAYYAEQTRAGGPIRVVGVLVALFMGTGSCFGVMNTFYATVARRTKEIATLRVLGFSRKSVLVSFVVESLLLAAVGGILGLALMLPFNGLKTGTQNASTFSEVVFTFSITPAVAALALGYALVLGFFGGLAPAWQAAHEDILTKRRD